MEIQTDCEVMKLNFNPAKYKTQAGAAKAFHKALCKFAKEVYGQVPDVEIHLHNPEQSKERGYGPSWRVSWEAGPFEWGIYASQQVFNYEAGWYTEPYYSFDVCFAK